MNAKNEFLRHIKEAKGELICCKVIYHESFNGLTKNYYLNAGFTTDDLTTFLESLDFNYDSGYGRQYLYGLILFTESHSRRHEYDGSEWWVNYPTLTVEQVMNFEL
jgi:hypothetical protein